MATHKLIILKSYFNFIYDSFPADLVMQTMMKVCSFVWILVCNLVLSSFRHIIKHLLGSRIDDDKEHDRILDLNEHEEGAVRSSDDSGFGEEEKSEFTFGFKFQVKEEDLISYKDAIDAKTGEKGDDYTENESAPITNTSKYEFVSVKDFGGFVVEPKSVSFTVHELFVEEGLKNDDLIKDVDNFIKDDDFIIKEKVKSQDFDELEVKQEDRMKDEQKELNETEVSFSPIYQSGDISDKDSIGVEEKVTESVTGDFGCDEGQGLEAKNTLNLGENGDLKQEQEQVNWLGDFFMRNDSLGYGFNYSPEIEIGSLDDHQPESDFVDARQLKSTIPPVSEAMDDDFIELEPYLEKEQHNSDPLVLENEIMKSNKIVEEIEVKMKTWEFDLNEDDEDEDVLLEHQELIGQMKMELKNSRTGGLPTILEESETPKMKEDLKPLKIDEKLEHRDQMAEIQKFYKSYTEKMRKLDVLNYQTLQAINFLKMKHPDQMNTEENASLSAIKSVLMPSLWPCKLRKIYADPTLKSITELHKDLEIVYVGQACLSWEILHWQYKKAKELQLYDPQGYRSYNQIAIEFQQFHVLLRRFTEDELFQGPRVLNYTKQRCTLRGLLQVPAIKDDNLKEKQAKKEDAVSTSTMAKMIQESMTVFWEFLHTDKDTTNLFLTIILQGSKAHLQDPADSDLFMEVKTIHQKKDKRLKDLLRTGNCIVRKFQKQQETILDQHMFVSQVELRLVSRVLSLPRLTRDQLIWCQNKLNNIKFMDRKIQVEDSLFLLFPC
ncbi:uncharacterized protein [Rutidosis leptorrhynchoides]|uniref:uncharacterized protein n=1 Tax=Rutidosis leptorrhynchoides TaxID=125765 RepID=UPI003A995789